MSLGFSFDHVSSCRAPNADLPFRAGCVILCLRYLHAAVRLVRARLKCKSFAFGIGFQRRGMTNEMAHGVAMRLRHFLFVRGNLMPFGYKILWGEGWGHKNDLVNKIAEFYSRLLMDWGGAFFFWNMPPCHKPTSPPPIKNSPRQVIHAAKVKVGSSCDGSQKSGTPESIKNAPNNMNPIQIKIEIMEDNFCMRYFSLWIVQYAAPGWFHASRVRETNLWLRR